MPSAIKKISELLPDTKQELIEKLGDLSGFTIAQNEVLLAIYVRPQMTPGGILVTPNYLKEDLYQGKVGLVVKIGAACEFVRTSASGRSFGIDVKLHDWVVTRPADTWPIDVNGRPDVLLRSDFVACRLVFDDQIRGVIAHPGMVW